MDSVDESELAVRLRYIGGRQDSGHAAWIRLVTPQTVRAEPPQGSKISTKAYAV